MVIKGQLVCLKPWEPSLWDSPSMSSNLSSTHGGKLTHTSFSSGQTLKRPRSIAIISRQSIRLCNLRFSVESGILFIELPSGRRLAYVQPRLGENRWGGTSITYTGTTTACRWGQLETYGGKLTENIVQAIARDLLVTDMHAVVNAGHRIVMHVHDEIVIDEPLDSGFTVTDACHLMSTLPAWAEGLPLDADGYECGYYRKD